MFCITVVVSLLTGIPPVSAALGGSVTPRLKPLVTVADLNVGESQTVELCDGSRATVKLLGLKETRDDIRNAVRRAVATVEINGKTVPLVYSTYRLPTTIAGVQIDCPVTRGYLHHSSKQNAKSSFVGIENILGGVVLGKEGSLVTIGLNGSDIQAISEHEVGDRVYAIIKPEDITFSLSREKSSARNVFEGKITKVTPVGPLVRLEADCRFPLFGLVTNRSAQELGLTIGKQIYASFKATVVHIIKRWN